MGKVDYASFGLPESVSAELPKSAPTPAPSLPAQPKQPKPPAPVQKRYDQYERKDIRLTSGQYDSLTRLSRQLTRARNDKTQPRITENTLIRIAIDMLLLKSDRLAGESEAQLRRSVGL